VVPIPGIACCGGWAETLRGVRRDPALPLPPQPSKQVLSNVDFWRSVLRGMGGDFKRLSDEILADPEAREAVWGKAQYIKSVQPGGPDRPEEEKP